MVARIFAPLPRIFLRTFAMPSAATWIRHREDGSFASDDLQVIFNASSTRVSADGLGTDFNVPIARCAVADALKLEPSRAGDLTLLFLGSGRDQLVIGGMTYEVESCRADGYGMCEIELFRKRT
jgi:hypothetical protein